MYQPMLFLHWKQVRMVLGLFVVAAFALPLMAVEGLGTPPGMDAASLDAYRTLSAFQLWLPFFPALAAAIGVTLALSSWNWDHQQHHVYALSLPVTRWEYTIQKMLAGVTLALLPAVAFWLGAHVAAASISLPTGLNAYPNELAARFFFATLLSYAGLFAMAAGTVRTTLWVSGVVSEIFEWMLRAPGPFEVFTGNWSLIDV